MLFKEPPVKLNNFTATFSHSREINTIIALAAGATVEVRDPWKRFTLTYCATKWDVALCATCVRRTPKD